MRKKRLFFGDFLLARQKKVTPPPGGTPGMGLATNPQPYNADFTAGSNNACGNSRSS